MPRFFNSPAPILAQTQALPVAPAPTAPVQPAAADFPGWLLLLPIGAGLTWLWLKSTAKPIRQAELTSKPEFAGKPKFTSETPEAPIPEPAPVTIAPVTTPLPALNPSGIQPFNASAFKPLIVEEADPEVIPSRELPDLTQSQVEAVKYNVGQEYPEIAASEFSSTDMKAIDLATVDQDLPDLTQGYDEPRLILMVRDPQWAYAYWDVPNAVKQAQRDQGGVRLALRLYDVTHLGGAAPQPHSTQQYEIDELAQNWYLTIPVSDRDYVAELGYLTASDHWLSLVRSPVVHVPPVYPSDWQDDQMVTIAWDEPLIGRHFGDLRSPEPKSVSGFHDTMFDLSRPDHDAVAGSVFGHDAAGGSPLSSFVLPSSHEWASGRSDWGRSGSGDSTWLQSRGDANTRQFWFVADAELIVYGATESSAQVTIDGKPVQLTPEGTFRIQLSFQDGQLRFPVVAIAQDGVQTRQVELKFERQTPYRRTNWPGQE
jgi:hypothetical protein